MKYELYKGYILGPGAQMPAYGIYEVSVFGSIDKVRAGLPLHVSESSGEAMFWVDSHIEDFTDTAPGVATQADVDELNREAESVIRPLPEILTPSFLRSLKFCVSAAEGDGAIGRNTMDEYIARLDEAARALGYKV